jgi:hypothetical protein
MAVNDHITDDALVLPAGIRRAILSSVGIPILEIEDLHLTDQDVDDLFIWPAMQLYFSYYPKKLTQTFTTVSNLSIPFPNEYVFGVKNARVSLSQYGGALTKNPFINSVIMSRTMSTGRTYGKLPDGRDPYTSRSTTITEQQSQQSYMNLIRTQDFELDYENRELVVYSSISGTLVVTWAMYSRNWNAVRFEHQQNTVIPLAKANLLRFVGMRRNDIQDGTNADLPGDHLIAEADRLIEPVMERFNAIVPVIVAH